ncbi:MAG: biotin/lipoyl-binding protein, partial [Anaerolineae bacterium]
MKRMIIAAAVVLGLAMAVVGGWWYVQENPAWGTWLQEQFDAALVELGVEPEEEPRGLVASGFVEATQVAVTTELGGRIVAIGADEGDQVAAGEVLVQLDDGLLLAQIELAEADVAVAEAMFEEVRAGVRQETLDRARAQLAQAQMAQAAARVAREDAEAMLANPQDMALAVTAARSQAQVLDLQERQAEALAAAAQAANDFADDAVQMLMDVEPHTEWVEIGSYDSTDLPGHLPEPPSLVDGKYRLGPYRVVIKGGRITFYVRARIAVPADVMDEARYQQATTAYEAWTAWTAAAQTEAAREGAEAYLGTLASQAADPLTLEAQANAAAAQYEIATAAVTLANAQVEGLKMGATPEQIAAMEAQVEVARSALDALLVQLDKFTLGAPISGLVLERAVHVGEVAAPGAPLLTL